jgi:glycosyltransferase involved in cell wall biosynthesis
MARPELQDARASLAAQTYPHLEIVLVDATGGRHAPPPASCGRHAVLYVAGPSPRSRPVAANAGLDAATGDYIGFLDDDDWLEPGHVAGLVAALEAQPEYVVAYAHAREVDDCGATVRVRDEPYSRFMLFQDCPIAIHAALFRASLRDSLRFDPTFDIFEDWDFWIQASAFTDFLRVPQVTAIYRSGLGRSGSGHGANRDSALLETYHRRIEAKWRAEGERLAQALEEHYRTAESAFENGDLQRAEALVHEVLTRYRYHVSALMLAGTLAALRGEFATAATHFAAAVHERPDDADVRFNLAQALDRSGKAVEALAAYKRVLALSPTHPHARARLQRLVERKGA